MWHRILLLVLAIALVLIAEKAWAGGSNYGTKPGLWVTLFGSGKLAQVDPVGRRVLRDVALPAGRDGGPYAVTVDAHGMVWANEISTDTVVRLDPASGDLQRVKLPTANAGIRKMAVDGGGRLWYMGSHNGRLGMVR